MGRPAERDGNDCQNHIIGNCRITPIEVFETRFPITVLSTGCSRISGSPDGFAVVWQVAVWCASTRRSCARACLWTIARIGPWSLFGGNRAGRRGSPSAGPGRPFRTVHRGIRDQERHQVRRHPPQGRRSLYRELRRRRLWRPVAAVSSWSLAMSPMASSLGRRRCGTTGSGGGDGRGHAGAAMRDVKFDFADRVVVVTGAGKGIGRRISIAFAAAGAHVVLAGRHREPLEAVAKQARRVQRPGAGRADRRAERRGRRWPWSSG